jgi:hypothetical protein
MCACSSAGQVHWMRQKVSLGVWHKLHVSEELIFYWSNLVLQGRLGDNNIYSSPGNIITFDETMVREIIAAEDRFLGIAIYGVILLEKQYGWTARRSKMRGFSLIKVG